MLGEKKLKQISETILALSGADQTEVLLGSGESTAIRFANNFVHQPTTRCGNWVSVRLVFGKRIGVASTNQLNHAALKGLVDRVAEICHFQKDDPGFKSLSGPKKLIKINFFDKRTGNVSSLGLAKKVKVIIDEARENHFSAFGDFSRGVSELAIANSLGVWAYQTNTQINLSTIITGNEGSGYASDLGWRLGQIDEKQVAQKAVKKALASQNPQSLEPGEYEVILEPAAFEEVLDFFAWLGPNARTYHEDVSYFKGKIGKKIFSPLLTIIDDPFDRRGLPAAFDYEGQPKRKLTIIDRGVIKNIAYDSYYAKKYGKKNTGHALPAPNTFGPLTSHLAIEPGKSSLDRMISRVKRGLLVTRLWYIRVVHVGEMLLTGMTRDGTFLIENGRITKPVKNLRFTESIPNMFKNILEIGKELSPHSSWGGGAHLVPPIRIANFRFTGKTDH